MIQKFQIVFKELDRKVEVDGLMKFIDTCYFGEIKIKEMQIKPCIHTREVNGIVEKCAGEEGHVGYHSTDVLVTMLRKIPLGSDDDSHA